MLAGTTDTHPGDLLSTTSELSGRGGEMEITWVLTGTFLGDDQTGNIGGEE